MSGLLQRGTAALLIVGFASTPVASTPPQAAPAKGAPAPAATDARAIAGKLEARLASLKDLEARIVQVRKSELYPEGDRATGTISYKSPSRIRIEFREPSPLSLYLTKDKFILYDPAEKQAQRYSRAADEPNGPLFLLDLEPGELLRRFDVKWLGRDPRGSRILLTNRPDPKPPATGGGRGGADPGNDTGYPDAIQVVVDARTSLPREISWVEATGDSVSAFLDQFQIDRGIPASRFEFKPPPGVDVIDDLRPTGP